MRYGNGYGKLFACENLFSDKSGGTRMSYRRKSVLSAVGVLTASGGTVRNGRMPGRRIKERRKL